MGSASVSACARTCTSLADCVRVRVQVRWVDIGAEKPTSGHEVDHAALAIELARLGVRGHSNQHAIVEFSQDQFDQLQVPSIAEGAYVKARNNKYYKRADSFKRRVFINGLAVDTSPVKWGDSSTSDTTEFLAEPCTRRAADLFQMDAKRELGESLSSLTKIELTSVMKQNFPNLSLSEQELQVLADKIKLKEQKRGEYIPSVSTRVHLQNLVYEVLRGTRDPLPAGWDNIAADDPEHEVSLIPHEVSCDARYPLTFGWSPTSDGEKATSTSARCRVFLGYRVAADAELVEILYDKLRANGIDVWMDKKCLKDGQRWEDGFADGLFESDVFVPVLSKKALKPFADLSATKGCDNVLLEHQMALEFQDRGRLRAIFPLFVGSLAPAYRKLEDGAFVELPEPVYGPFFPDGSPECEDVVVNSVEDKLWDHLGRLGMDRPKGNSHGRTVKVLPWHPPPSPPLAVRKPQFLGPKP